MDQKYFEDQFLSLKKHIDKRFDSIEKPVDITADGFIRKIATDFKAIRTDLRLIAETQVMLYEKISRFENEYIRHAIETRQDILNLYKMTYGQLERRVKELETAEEPV